MLIVAALGGNALLRRGQPPDQAVQQRNVDAAVHSLAGLAAEHRLVITHGNGPQVGFLALAQEASRAVAPYSLDILGSETQGMIGYLVEEAMREALPAREVATLLTQVMVDAADPAFVHPTKPIGPGYGEPDARRLTTERGWTMARDGGAFRRVVPSPAPQRILEMAAVRLLVEHDVTVICAGGGGVPVVVDRSGAWRGVEAVIDKDHTAALLARELRADLLLLLTDVDAVQTGWGTSEAQKIYMATPLALRRERFAEGSMAPKVEAACQFVEATGHRAAIGSLEQTGAILRGQAGTHVVREGITPMSFWPEAGGTDP